MVVLTITSPFAACYLRQGSSQGPGSSFVFDPSGGSVSPTVDECESDGNHNIEIDVAADSIRDENGTDYFKIVGGRPRTRKRK